MTALANWFRARSLREQRLLLVMLAIALPLLLWLLVWQPVKQGLSAAKERHAEAVERHSRVLAAAESLQQARRTDGTPGGELAAYVGGAAGRSGLTLASADAQGPDRLAVAIAAGDPRAVVGWLRGFEQQGLAVADLRMTPAPDGTVALTATLARPGR